MSRSAKRIDFGRDGFLIDGLEFPWNITTHVEVNHSNPGGKNVVTVHIYADEVHIASGDYSVPSSVLTDGGA